MNKYFLFFFACLLSLFSYAKMHHVLNKKDVREFKQALHRVIEKSHLALSYQATSQTKRREYYKFPPVYYSGYIYVLKSKKFIWKNEKTAIDWYYDSQSLYKYDRNTRQSVRYETNQDIAQPIFDIVHLVLDTRHLFEGYRLFALEKSKKTWKIEIVPKKKLTKISKIFFSLKKGGSIKTLKIFYKDGSFSNFQFKEDISVDFSKLVFRPQEKLNK